MKKWEATEGSKSQRGGQAEFACTFAHGHSLRGTRLSCDGFGAEGLILHTAKAPPPPSAHGGPAEQGTPTCGRGSAWLRYQSGPNTGTESAGPCPPPLLLTTAASTTGPPRSPTLSRRNPSALLARRAPDLCQPLDESQSPSWLQLRLKRGPHGSQFCFFFLYEFFFFRSQKTSIFWHFENNFWVCHCNFLEGRWRCSTVLRIQGRREVSKANVASITGPHGSQFCFSLFFCLFAKNSYRLAFWKHFLGLFSQFLWASMEV